MIVAVDGPAGSGKGTVTKRIEKELGFLNLDTGATYRCVALHVLRENVSLKDEEEIIKIANDIDIKINNTGDKDIILLNGEDVSKEIRTKEVTSIVSQVSSIIPVREKMVEVQRKLANGKNVIVEGRDIGTVVFPNADIKIYLDASEEIRAQRRYEENKQNGIDTTYEEVLENVKMRDYNDMHKKIGALKKAEDAIVVDSTNLTIDQVVEKVKNIIMSLCIERGTKLEMKKQIIMASGNKGKIKEAQEILEDYEIIPMNEIGIDIDVEEDQDTFEGNARKKAETIAKKLNGKMCLADDSGIQIEYLDGFPGVFTKRWHKGTDRERNEALIEKLNGVPHEKRKIKFVTAMALSDGEKTIIAVGEIQGYVAEAPRGENGFGFDEIFELEDGRTLAEISAKEKNQISARKKALGNLKEKLKTNNIIS